VEDPLYRRTILIPNNIVIQRRYEPYPEDITHSVASMNRGRQSPGPSLHDIREDKDLDELWMGSGESQVEEYFKDRIFPKFLASDVLKYSCRQPMTKSSIPTPPPSTLSTPTTKISTPVPDLLYGYNTTHSPNRSNFS
jgi:hypothetical protein